MARFDAPSATYWEESWEASAATSDRQAYLEACDVFDPALAPFLEGPAGRRAFEVGCYPGGFLHHLARRYGYQASGIDVVPAVEALGAQLQSEGVTVGELLRGDFLTTAPDPAYDLVCSFGFVEHFPDPAAVVRQHVAWARRGGLVVVTVPHFRAGQWALHRVLDETSLRTHNLAAMSPALLRGALSDAGAEVLHVGRFGTCEFWVEPDPERSRPREQAAHVAAALLGKAGSAVGRLVGPRGVPNPLLSPFLVAVGRRR